MILQNPSGQCWTHRFSFALDRADYFSAADDLSSGKAGDLCGQHKIDLELRIRLKHVISVKEHSRAADVFGCAYVPLRIAEPAVAQR